VIEACFVRMAAGEVEIKRGTGWARGGMLA